MKRKRRPWYMTAFAQDYLERYKHRSDAAAARETPFLVRALDLPRGALILDLCCGTGRHARRFAQAGYNVIAVDLSEHLLCAAKATRPRRNITYLRADMRKLPLKDGSVDGAVSIFTSFGYFATDKQNARVLSEVARVLKREAPFIMDFLNVEPTLAALVPYSEKILNGARIIERRRFDPRRQRLVKAIRIVRGKRSETLRESVRAYTPQELQSMFAAAGLRVTGVCGDLEGASFDETRSPRCVIIARRQ